MQTILTAEGRLRVRLKNEFMLSRLTGLVRPVPLRLAHGARQAVLWRSQFCGRWFP